MEVEATEVEAAEVEVVEVEETKVEAAVVESTDVAAAEVTATEVAAAEVQATEVGAAIHIFSFSISSRCPAKCHGKSITNKFAGRLYVQLSVYNLVGQICRKLDTGTLSVRDHGQ